MKAQLVIITIKNSKAKLYVHNILENKISIGRNNDNDIIVDSVYVSAHHGYLQVLDGKIYYIDLNSSNGSYVDNRMIEKSTYDNIKPICLNNRSYVFLGDNKNKEGAYIFYIENTDDSYKWKIARANQQIAENKNTIVEKVGIVRIYAEKTVSVSGGAMKKNIPANTENDSEKDITMTMVVVSVDENEMTINQHILEKDTYIVGRNEGREDSYIQIKNVAVSREQAIIEKSNGKYYYTEKGMNQFSFVGERTQKIGLNQKVEIRDKDILSIGNIEQEKGVIIYFSTNMYDNYNWNIRRVVGRDILIGREKNNFICLPQLSVSRKHARIFVKNNNWYIEDLKSANGLLLNYSILKKTSPMKIGDVVDIVNNKIVFLKKYVLYAVPKKIESGELNQNIKVKSGELKQNIKVENREKINVKADEKHSYKGGIEVELSNISRIVPCKKGTGINGGNKKYILQDISLTIKAGQLVAILGGSGAGKTTFMNCVNGFEPATSGIVKINGKELYSNYNALKSQIGYVPQQDIVHEELTLESMLRYVAKLRLPKDLSKDEIDSKVKEVIKIVDLEPHSKTYIKKLSGGQKKRASIAVELLSDPELFFLDEPTSGLDPEAETNLMKRLRVLSTQRGKTVLVITHTLQNIHLFDKVIFLAPGGKLCFYGSPKEALKFFDVDNLSDAYEKIEKNVDGYVNKYKKIQETA